jgi:tetratricopeptide (TPR) repeat protein
MCPCPKRRHPRWALLVLLFSLLSVGTATGYFWSQYHLNAAQRALEGYSFEEAQYHLGLCLKVRFRSAGIHLLAAQTARRRDAYEEAERHLSDSIQLGGMTPAAALERELLSAQQGELDGVESSLRRCINAGGPNAVLALEALAKGYANRFWESESLECLNLLLQRQPRHPQALLMRARAWEKRAQDQMERGQLALRDYENAVELNPSFECQLGLAGALYQVGRPWEAMRVYERLCAIQPDNPEARLGLARCRYNLHEIDAARQLMDDLLEQYPHHASALLERGRLALHAGQWTEAEKWLRQAAAAAPRDDNESLLLLCRCLEAGQQNAEARRCREELRRRQTEDLDVQRRILQSNRDPQDVALRYEIATELMRLGHEQDSVAFLFLVLEQQPGHEPARAALADYFERSGQPGRAARYRRARLPMIHASIPPR